MKKKKFAFLFVLMLVLTSCLFESSDNGFESWAESKGVPSSYKVQTLTISDLQATSAEAFLDTAPRSADSRFVLGSVSNLKHDLAMDFAFVVDSNFMKSMKSSDSTGAFLLFAWLTDFYKDANFPKDSLDVSEDLDVEVSWIIETSNRKKFADSLSDVSDSMWYDALMDWNEASSADTSFQISLSELDSSVRLDLPTALVDDLKNLEKYARIQVKLSVKNASRAYRFYGEDTNYPPYLSLWYGSSADSLFYLSHAPARQANLITNEEDCTECPVLHGGVFDSIVVELPPEPILKALSDFYGDEFPVGKNEKFDTRQNVVLAQLTFARDDSKGSQELELPIQVVVGSYIDSSNTVIRRMENYRLNNDLILEEGHPNLIFHEGDSLSLQITYGVRDFINRAQDGRSLKFMVRMGYPFLQEKDTTYAKHVTDSGDTLNVFLSHFDYARYDFSTLIENPMTLKIWLASKRD